MVDAAAKSPSLTRLALCSHSDQQGTVDGAWWPPDRELRTALPDLVSVLGLWIGQVHRVLYDPTFWKSAPSRIIRGTTVISVDPYTMVAPDTIYLMGTHSRNWLLYVVPPATPAAGARQLLRAVSDATQPMSVGILRALGGRSPASVAEMG